MDSAKLATAVREAGMTIGELAECPSATISDFLDEIRVCEGLLTVLANIVDGMPVDRAFGSSWDWPSAPHIEAAIASKGI